LDGKLELKLEVIFYKKNGKQHDEYFIKWGRIFLRPICCIKNCSISVMMDGNCKIFCQPQNIRVKRFFPLLVKLWRFLRFITN
jgi:hypothetical protein